MKGTYEEQIELETTRKEETLNKYINNFYGALEKGTVADTSEGQLFLRLGFPQVVNKIEEYKNVVLNGTAKKDRDMLLNLCDDPKILAYTILSSLLTHVIKQNNNAKVTNVSSSVVNKLLLEQGQRRLKETDPKMFKYMDSAYRRANKKRKLKLMEIHMRNMQSKVDIAANILSITTKNDAAQNIRIGSRLLDCVVNSGINLFIKGKVYNSDKKGYTSVVKMTPEGKDVLKVAFSRSLSLLVASYSPMIVPPRPWVNNYSGGLLTHSVPIMKMKTRAGREKLKEYSVSKAFPVLNKLQETRWRINTFVVDTISDMFHKNMIDPRSSRKLPRIYGGLPASVVQLPQEIVKKSHYGLYNEETGMFDRIEDFKLWKRDIEAVTISLDGELGRRLQLISALGEAQTYLDYDAIYFSYTLDSRGRVYTQQSVVTPQSSAEVKAMLEFSDGQHLDERGEYWFKIHTANVYGKDKEDYAERIRWFDDNLSNIRRVATNPLGNLGDWCYADSPFEFLGAARAWVDHEAGEKVHVPIQLDATNSGVQIYSGLLGDLEGAETVNVVDTGSRADVYQIVADKVNKALLAGNYPKMFHATLSDGTEKSQSTRVEAESLAGNITRKHTKTNTMTVPYSVSKRGMSDQIKDLQNAATLADKEWWEGDHWIVNKLLTDLNYDAIYETIPGAKVGQDYLVALASLCNEKDGMFYTTPIYNIPVVQKKPRTEVSRVQTVLGSLSFREDILGSVDKIAQKNGSAPNYIHSIDSTLLLRVIETISNNIGVIHDCFISHANDGDELQLRFKEAYVEIMKMRPLELIGEQLDPEGLVVVPYIGTLNLDDVMDARYIIS